MGCAAIPERRPCFSPCSAASSIVGLSSVRTGHPDPWNRHAFRPLMAFGRAARHAEFPGLPTGRELAADPGARSLIEFAEFPFFMALPFAAPPDVPPDRASALQV